MPSRCSGFSHVLVWFAFQEWSAPASACFCSRCSRSSWRLCGRRCSSRTAACSVPVCVMGSVDARAARRRARAARAPPPSTAAPRPPPPRTLAWRWRAVQLLAVVVVVAPRWARRWWSRRQACRTLVDPWWSPEPREMRTCARQATGPHRARAATCSPLPLHRKPSYCNNFVSNIRVT